MRIDVGGKIMTNFLRDKLTYSQFDLRQETKVVNEMKEDVCYFAKDFRQEMELFKKSNPVIEYYLPDHNLLRRGQIKQSTDLASFKDLSTIMLGVERFVLPETIFFPEITDCDQIGLKEAINRTCNGVFNYNLFGRYMLKNIIVFGGNAAIPGLKERLQVTYFAYDVPESIENCINVSSNPIIEPWLAAQYLINNVPSFSTKFVSKKEYQEHGNRICDERFIDIAPKEWYDLSSSENFHFDQ
uniref:Uncharacterized protein n=1 Tax=Panagrolaimus superbus TaxID=310955 RepID=A0A914YID0_9BILA